MWIQEFFNMEGDIVSDSGRKFRPEKGGSKRSKQSQKRAWLEMREKPPEREKEQRRKAA